MRYIDYYFKFFSGFLNGFFSENIVNNFLLLLKIKI